MCANKCNLPKNIRQIGHTLADNKIYIEDYVMTYVKQLYNEPFDKEKIVILVGQEKCIDDRQCLFVNGTIEIDYDIKTYKEILENNNIKDITRIREDFFYDQDIVGLGLIIKNEWFGFDEEIREYFASGLVGNTVIIYDINEEEMVYTYNYKGFLREKGYYIYYDRNESMQNYMLCMKDGKSIEYGYSTTEIVDNTIDEKIRMYTIPKNTVYTSKKVDFNKYKDLFERKWSKKIKYCGALSCMIAVLALGVVKIDKFEQLTKKKAKDIVGVTKEVINNKSIEKNIEASGEENKNTEIIERNKIIEKGNEPVKKEKILDEKSDDIKEKATKMPEKENKEAKVQNNSQNVKFYVVKKGDALVDISKKLYGTVKKVDTIKKINGLQDEDKIYIGQKLIIP